MKKTFVCLFLSLATAAAAAETVSCPRPQDAGTRQKTLTAFVSEAELDAFVKCLAEGFRNQQAARFKNGGPGMAKSGGFADSAVPSPAPAAIAEARSAKAAEGESVTNVQTAGVDEGGIVKTHGNHLVILRRGRLFTIAIDHDQLKPVAALDAYSPEASPGGAWYDEMLISGNTIVIIGYSYARGGTEVGLFNIDADGRLAYRATYHLRSNDYYSSRNYASRLIGDKLIFYTPLALNFHRPDPYAAFPAVRRWSKDAKPDGFRRIAPATRIYTTDEAIDPMSGNALHTVSICDLSAPELDCRATAILGPQGRVFYVSAQSVYVWTTTWGRGKDPARSAVFRIPLDGSAPTALKTSGAPTDQFSFLESEDVHLNVLLRAQGKGDAMWAGEHGRGDTALLRVPLSAFGDGRDSAPPEAYRRLPHPAGHTLQNRFVGKFVLYGTGSNWGRPIGEAQNLYVTRWDSRGEAQALPLAHSVDRIEAIGTDAVAVGTAGSDLLFTSVELKATAAIASTYLQKNAAQGETRSHGFFYKPSGKQAGLIGLPVVGAGRPGYRQLHEQSAAVLFLKNHALKLTELGALESRAGNIDDGCRASCVDWYGNSRPLFLKGRVFALMGYELVEGRLKGDRIAEVRRINYAPKVSVGITE